MSVSVFYQCFANFRAIVGVKRGRKHSLCSQVQNNVSNTMQGCGSPLQTYRQINFSRKKSIPEVGYQSGHVFLAPVYVVAGLPFLRLPGQPLLYKSASASAVRIKIQERWNIFRSVRVFPPTRLFPASFFVRVTDR